MTAPSDAEPGSGATGRPAATDPLDLPDVADGGGSAGAPWYRRRWPAMAALLVVYVVVGLATDAGGYLGTDTGGKVATLEAMSRAGAFDPDLGYWAADVDPDGELHPMYFTSRVGDRYVNVTTLPMLLVAAPLYEVGGYHLAVVVAAVGAVLAAAAAAALSRRLNGDDGWTAFWLVGLATPVALYALDLWEHAPGLALMGWAVVATVDVVDGRRPPAFAALAGLGWGAAATMRTEALVYGAVVTAAALVVLVARRSPRAVPADGPPRPGGATAAAVAGLAAAVGVVVPMVVNDLLERAVYGGDAVRSGRAGGAAARVGDRLPERIQEGLLTTFGASASASWLAPVVTGAVVVGLLVVAVHLGRGRRRDRAVLCAGAAAALWVTVTLASGLGFVPGLLVASPLAAAGLLGLVSGRGRWLVIAVLVALPAVWAFQYLGGAGPQWGGRYQLTTGLVLAVAGVRVLRSTARPVAVVVVALSAVLTAGGVAWLVVRSHQVGGAFEQLADRDDALLVSRSPHFLREGGAAVLDQPWLTVSSSEDLRAAADLAAGLGLDRWVLLAVGDDVPARVPGWHPTTVEEVPLFDGDPIVLQTYERGDA